MGIGKYIGYRMGSRKQKEIKLGSGMKLDWEVEWEQSRKYNRNKIAEDELRQIL